MNFYWWSLARNWSGLHHLHLFLSQFRCRIGVQTRKHHDSVHRRCSSRALACTASCRVGEISCKNFLRCKPWSAWNWPNRPLALTWTDLTPLRRWDIAKNTVERRRDDCPGYMDMWHINSDISICQGVIICVLRNVIDLFLKMMSKMKA